MVDFAAARRAMVDSQLLTGGVLDRRILRAMGQVPRELFVPPARRDLAYIDDLHALGSTSPGRYIAAPATLGRLLQLAAPAADEAVLLRSAATGYAAAVLAGLTRSVVAIEPDPDLAAMAQRNIAELGLANVTLVPDEAGLGSSRFDCIILDEHHREPPATDLARLRSGGRLVAVIREGVLGVAMLYEAGTDGPGTSRHFSVALPALRSDERLDQFIF